MDVPLSYGALGTAQAFHVCGSEIGFYRATRSSQDKDFAIACCAVLGGRFRVTISGRKRLLLPNRSCLRGDTHPSNHRIVSALLVSALLVSALLH